MPLSNAISQLASVIICPAKIARAVPVVSSNLISAGLSRQRAPHCLPTTPARPTSAQECAGTVHGAPNAIFPTDAVVAIETLGPHLAPFKGEYLFNAWELAKIATCVDWKCILLPKSGRKLL